MKRLRLVVFILSCSLFALITADKTINAGSALVSNPLWQFLGLQSITGVQAQFDRIIVNPPFGATGRVTAIAADPTTESRLFVGTAGGGVWMTTDGGMTFTRITFSLDPSTTGQSWNFEYGWGARPATYQSEYFLEDIYRHQFEAGGIEMPVEKK